MILILRRSSVLLLLTIPILIYIIALVGRATGFSRVQKVTNSVPTVVIDPGHGAPDGGTVGKTGVQEKDINLAVAKFVKDLLLKEGINVIMTREGDSGIYPAGRKFSKKADLEARKKIMNNSGADLFVSIHMNSFTDPRYSGAQVFYSRTARGSRELAQILQTKLREICDRENKREIKPADNSINILRSPKIPAVIVECGFLSNEREERLLIDESYQQRLATAITLGIVEFLNQYGRGGSPRPGGVPSGTPTPDMAPESPQPSEAPSGTPLPGMAPESPQPGDTPQSAPPSVTPYITPPGATPSGTPLEREIDTRVVA